MNSTGNGTPKRIAICWTLALFACVALAQVATADVQLGATPGFAAEQLAAAQYMGLDVPSWMVGTTTHAKRELKPTDPNHPNFPLDCSDFNDFFCGVYVQDGCCCVPLDPPPNAFCPDVCV